MADKFLIGPFQTGWQDNIRPWLIPNEAFELLENAYVYHQRIEKRPGLAPLYLNAAYVERNTRLRIFIDTTDGDGNASGTVPGVLFKVGQSFSIGDAFYTVVSNVAGAQPMLQSVVTTTATYTIGTGAYNFVGAPLNTDVYFYPSEPVMGFGVFEQEAVNNERTIAFDTQFAYMWNGTEWERLDTGSDTWTGNDANFFWSITAPTTADVVPTFFTTNRVNNIRYWNGATWTAFTPQYGPLATDIVVSARIIVYFKNRMILMNLVEDSLTSTPYRNSIRYSSYGDPLNATAWREDLSQGGFKDAPTSQAIISASFLRDRLIVHCERSTYELVYTSNEVDPFRFQLLDSNQGVESSFSTISLDYAVYGVGETGIYACNGMNVRRIDEKIHHEVFTINNLENGHERVAGIRDYFLEYVYWTYPNKFDQTSIYNNKFPSSYLMFDYTNGGWARCRDSITAFGYVQNVGTLTWSAARFPWSEANQFWQDPGILPLFRRTIGGNQQGFTFILHYKEPRNLFNFQITNITITVNPLILELIVRNHNLNPGEFFIIDNVVGTGNFQDLNDEHVYIVGAVIDEHTIQCAVPLDNNNQPIIIAGDYLGEGTLSWVSQINIKTKQFNFYGDNGRGVAVQKVDFFVDSTLNGEIQVDFSVNTSNYNLAQDIENASLGNNVLELFPNSDINPFERYQKSFWHPIYIQADGDYIQLFIYYSTEQMLNYDKATSPFTLNAMLFHAQPSSSRLGG